MLFGLVRRDVMVKTHLHGAYPSADWALILEWALHGAFIEVPERLFLRRLHPGMSRAANRDTSSVAEWFEPGSGATAKPEFLRLFVEQCKAITRAPVGAGTRMHAGTTFVPVFLARHKRAMMREATAIARHQS